MYGQRDMAQLRWATFGGPSEINSRPHLDCDGDMVGAHNGNVVNNVELREPFTAEGRIVCSQHFQARSSCLVVMSVISALLL